MFHWVENGTERVIRVHSQVNPLKGIPVIGKIVRQIKRQIIAYEINTRTNEIFHETLYHLPHIKKAISDFLIDLPE